MKYGVFIFPTDTAIRPDELAREVEGRGFESLWFPEHSHIPVSRETPWGGVKGAKTLPDHYWRTHDQFVALAFAAAATETLKLGTGITLLAQRDPIWTAKEVASLDHLSNGRVIFGIGYGWNKEEMGQHGTAYTERRTLLREKALIMKALWTEEEASFEGVALSLEPSWAWPKPVQKPHPPIIMGAGAGPRTIADMVEFCDGWMPLATRHDITDQVARVRSAVAEAGRDPAAFEITAYAASVDKLKILEEAGVDRAVFTLPPAGPATILPSLDELAAAAGLPLPPVPNAPRPVYGQLAARNDPLGFAPDLLHDRAMGERDLRLVRYALSNGGVITRSEALALGMSSTTIQRRLAAGHLVSVGRGTYVLPEILQSEVALLRAATSALDAVASHESAARLHGVEGLDPRQIAVSVPIRRSNRFPGVVVHQLTDLEQGHTTLVDGIPVTDPMRTVIDLAAVLPTRLLAAAVDQVVRRGLSSYSEIGTLLDKLARRGKRGVRSLRNVLEPRLGGAFVSESVLETRLLQVIEDGGLPRPTTQFRPPWLRHMNGRVDLAYTDQHLLVEGDSQRWHGTPEAFQADRRRDNLAQIAGWTILRFTWEDISKRQEYLVGTIRAALDLSERRNTRIRVAEH